jgi:L-rhamnose mutarotase
LKDGVKLSLQRYGMVIGLNAENVEEYSRLHANVWQAVLARIAKSNIRNYSIFHREPDSGEHVLFSYYEYVGENYEEDKDEITADP